MIRTYLKASLRYLLRQKFYTITNVTGLALGITTFLLITLYINHELSFDTFHSKADRIYGLTSVMQGKETSLVNMPMTELLQEQFPDIEQSVRMNVITKTLLTIRNEKFYEKDLLYADSSFFEIFDFSLLEGDRQTALRDPYSIIISQELAKKYYGDKSALGQSLVQTDESSGKEIQLIVTGVLKPLPSNSSLQFSGIVPMSLYETLQKQNLPPGTSTWNMMTGAVLLLRAGTSPEQAVNKFNTYIGADFIANQSDQNIKRATQDTLALTSFTSMHLYHPLQDLAMLYQKSEAGGIQYIYLMEAVALLVLIIACINYINLATAKASKRGLDVGLRKTIGAGKKHIILQHLLESFILVLLACTISLISILLILPSFNAFTERHMILPLAEPWVVLCGFVMIGLLSVLAGFYPAFYLSRMKPKQSLEHTASSRKSQYLRNALVGFQFFIAFLLIITAFVFKGQINYLQNGDLGFDRENKIILPMERKLKTDFSSFRINLLKQPGVEAVATSSGVPTKGYWGAGAKDIEGIESKGGWSSMTLTGSTIDAGFFRLMEMQIAEGRPFNDTKEDEENSVLVTETFARAVGWYAGDKREALGKYIVRYDDKKFYVIGVVKDFHSKSMKETIEPLVMFLRATGTSTTSFINAISYVTIDIKTDDIQKTVQGMKTAWSTAIPDYPFEYSFLDEDFDRLYRKEEKLSTMIQLFSILAVVISLMGVLGMAMFTVERRLKEIGIRKVLGASVANIIMLLSRGYVKLLVLAFVLAIPLGIVFINKSLEEFAYKIDVTWHYFVFPGIAVFLLTLFTVALQSLSAALTNPAETLRTE